MKNPLHLRIKLHKCNLKHYKHNNNNTEITNSFNAEVLRSNYHDFPNINRKTLDIISNEEERCFTKTNIFLS